MKGFTLNHVFIGDVLKGLCQIPDETVHTCVTSPPYYGLRDYGAEGQIGLEETPELFIAKLVEVFREVRRVLRKDGTLWVNIGDSYANAGRKTRDQDNKLPNRGMGVRPSDGENVKSKDLIGIPWMLAFALRADGWYLRQDIIWSKPNPMPESVTDRCTKAHEYIFLLSKSDRYYFNQESIKEPAALSSVSRLSQDIESQQGSARVPGKTNGNMKAVRDSSSSFKREKSKRGQAIPGQNKGTHRPDREESQYDLLTANKRSVWTVSTKPFKEAHFATFPEDLIIPCIKAGCPPGGIVLDPFMGAGTTALVARSHGRNYLGCEINPEYDQIRVSRLHNKLGMFA